MDRIYVAVRARPLSPEDAKTSPWRISGNSVFLPNQPLKFDFDRIFDERTRTAEVYEARTRDIVNSAIQGFNGTVFAYGQTNSGKTHTMRGSSNEAGIIPLAVHDLFQDIKEERDREFLVRMSYLEIYNEELNDLLVPEHRKLAIHESLERGVFVAGLKEEIVSTPQQVLDLMDFGESRRHIGETNMNLYSSRSHTIFRMIIESREKTEDSEDSTSSDAVRVSVLNLVDLAGSERASKTGAEGVRLKEGSHINKSLMTLGTVIKKLSEGAESQGGHVPYRDSKLTRILQPALGGNANTTIICNITLAQVHADETKSSLQFASRALRVTNCACVNEILTDAALLKRQKKKIEELQAKLQGSHSEHWEKEILCLRNTLLQSELEKERIALELEEEKKAKALRDKRLQLQAEKIANLSSLVLYSERPEETCLDQKKRRRTWCPGPLQSACHDVNLLSSSSEEIPFDKLEKQHESTVVGTQNDASLANNLENDGSQDAFSLPDECALHVTNRRKVNLKNAHMLTRVDEDIEAENIHVSECEVAPDLAVDGPDKLNQDSYFGHKSLTMRESEAILVIKQLQDQIKVLEVEKISLQKNLDNVVELATEQNLVFKEKYDELCQELLDARLAGTNAEEVRRVVIAASEETKINAPTALTDEIEDVVSQFNNSKDVVDDVAAMFKDILQNFSVLAKMFVELKEFASKDMQQSISIINSHQKVNIYMRKKAEQLLSEKEHNGLMKDYLLRQVVDLQKEVSCLSSSFLAKEKDVLRKDLDKAKSKLKETESKLKNAMQDKVKLESEKVQLERELKNLQNQRTLLDRAISKRESLIERRRDSRALDLNKGKGHAAYSNEHNMQLDYQKLEALASEMEAEIFALREDLVSANEEKEEASSLLEIKVLELEDVSVKLNTTSFELEQMKQEMDTIRLRLAESESHCKDLRDSVDMISEAKEEIAVQLTDALLSLEMEKSMHVSKENAFLEATKRLNLSDDEIAALSRELLEVKHEFDCCREQAETLREKMIVSEEHLQHERDLNLAMSMEIAQLRVDIEQHVITAAECEHLRSQINAVTVERDESLAANIKLESAIAEVEIRNQNYGDTLSKAKTDREELARRISNMEAKMQEDELSSNIEKTKFRMKLQRTEAKLDAYRGRYEKMNNEFVQASTKLKEQLSFYGTEILRLKKELVSKQAAAGCP